MKIRVLIVLVTLVAMFAVCFRPSGDSFADSGRPFATQADVSAAVQVEQSSAGVSGPDHRIRPTLSLTSLSLDEDGVLAEFMQQKLQNSSNILRGLMTEDFPMIVDSSDRLLDMSKAERWRASNDMMYLQHSQQFRNAVDDLKRKAAAKSMDGASLAWVNVTMSCIQCHDWVRSIMLADNEPL